MIPTILALTAGEFEAGAIAWLTAISLVLAALGRLVVKNLPLIIQVVTEIQNIKARQDRHRVELTELQTNAVPPAMLAAALPALVAAVPVATPAAEAVTDALAANTAATQENTEAQQAEQ